MILPDSPRPGDGPPPQSTLAARNPPHPDTGQVYPRPTRRLHRMPFGKHKGVLLKFVPQHYLKWLLRTVALSSDLRVAVLSELGRREFPPPPPDVRMEASRAHV